MSVGKYLTAQDAARQLGISTATLYSYVSRGLLRSEAAEGRTRAKRYLTEDVERLKRRQSMRRNPEKSAEMALNFGSPVLNSSITLIKHGKQYYRGQEVNQLAQTRCFEEIAALLWTGDFDKQRLLFPPPLLIQPPPQTSTLPLIERFQTILTHAAPQDLAAYGFLPDAVANTGARILHLITCSAINITSAEFGSSIAQTLQQAWLPNQPKARALLEAALIVSADHELNVSAFTARCIASARATPYAAVIGGLSALSGYRHGGATDRVAAFFREADGHVLGALRSYLQRGLALPGIGHTLYPQGDPRGTLLFEWVQREYGETHGARLGKEVAEAVRDNFGRKPNIDFALVTLARALELPADAPLTLFAIGRTAGWISHIIEQYASEELIRPRARYTGDAPSG
ncbi:MAG: citrate synthase family protein [Candidatus Promineifilaceae bacterium]